MVVLEMPGVEKKDIDVSLEDGVLTLTLPKAKAGQQRWLTKHEDMAAEEPIGDTMHPRGPQEQLATHKSRSGTVQLPYLPTSFTVEELDRAIAEIRLPT